MPCSRVTTLLNSIAILQDIVYSTENHREHDMKYICVFNLQKMNEMKEQRFNDEANAVKRNTKLKDKNRKGADIPGIQLNALVYSK